MLKKNKASMETMYNETLQAKEHARSALGAMHALTDRNNGLEEENRKLPGLTETCVSLGNLTRVLMWSAQEGELAVLLKVRSVVLGLGLGLGQATTLTLQTDPNLSACRLSCGGGTQ